VFWAFEQVSEVFWEFWVDSSGPFDSVWELGRVSRRQSHDGHFRWTLLARRRQTDGGMGINQEP
jgi:hypothetical protein